MLVINIIGISILVLFNLFIFNKKNKLISDYFLMLIIFLFAGILGTDIWMKQGISISNYISHLFFNTYIYPAIIIYGLLLIDKDSKNIFKKKWLWVVSYAILFSIFIISDILIFNDYSTPESVKDLFENPSIIHQIFYKGHYAFVIIVLFWFLKNFNNYKKGIKNYFSSIESIHLIWFRYFVYGYLAINILSLFLFLSLDFGIIKDFETPFNIEYSVLILLLFYLCYNGIKQYSLVSLEEFERINELKYDNSSKPVHEKYKSSSLSDKEMDEIHEKIEHFFIKEQVYLEPELKIDEIAKQLEVTTHKVSQTINSKAEMPFYDFVNYYRVEHFKRLLSSPENRKFTILALGIESGFNSKASLNRIFKKNTGTSPKEFQKRHFNI